LLLSVGRLYGKTSLEYGQGAAEHDAVAIAQQMRFAAGDRLAVDRCATDAAEVK